MNINQRLDIVARRLPKPQAKTNPFDGMTEAELHQVGREALEQLKADIIKDPRYIVRIDPTCLFFLNMESTLYNRPIQTIGSDPIPVELDDLDRQMIPKLQGLVDSDPHSLDKLPARTLTILKEKGLNL